jgi:hypothetical protein
MQLLPEDGTLQLRRVSLQSAATLRGGGSCQSTGGKGSCVLRLALRGEDLGAWMRESGQGDELNGAALRGELRVDWPMADPQPWLASVHASALLSAREVSFAPQPEGSAGWAAGLRALPATTEFQRLEADLSWQGRALELRSAVLRHRDGELTLSGHLDYATGQIDEQLAWRPQAAPATIPDALATLESVTRDRLPTLAGAMGDVGRWVSGAAAPQHWQVSGKIDAPTIEPVVAE